ncbi:MAG TPA: cupin domain-containing protein [Myxococcales bacterium]|jgi:AraC-like DNA-binding protein/uncharacterized cupin superfamily protein
MVEEAPDRTDALSEVIAVLRPQTVLARCLSGFGRWGVRYTDISKPTFCAVLDGACRLAVDGQRPFTLRAGDFGLLPAGPSFTISGFEPVTPVHYDRKTRPAPNGELIYGPLEGDPSVRLLAGSYAYDSTDASFFASLLPTIVHIRGVPRLTTLVGLVREEAVERRPGRDLVLKRLVEVLLIEALRTPQPAKLQPGLLRGLADPQLARAIRAMHAEVGRAWTVAELAKTAGLSRSAFFDRFHRVVGVAPMEYLLAWRMAVAKELLRGDSASSLDQIAERVGYGSASTFSTAFSRHVGQPPSRYARGI